MGSPGHCAVHLLFGQWCGHFFLGTIPFAPKAREIGRNHEHSGIVGASGATGRLLVQQLLIAATASAVVRAADRLPDSVRDHAGLMVIEAAVLDLSDAAMAEHVRGCDAVACCLGHNLTLKGIYGQPRRL
ncbi:MAG: NAD(P)H-binding protein [Caldilineaceae bacterium]